MQGKNNFYRPGWACEGRNNDIEEVLGHLWTIYAVYSNGIFVFLRNWISGRGVAQSCSGRKRLCLVASRLLCKLKKEQT